jgi:acyl carrier protein
MNEADLYQKLNLIFRETLGDDSIALTAETAADDVPEWDSMNHIFLVVEIERQFGIKFQTAEMEELRNVGELVQLIRSKQANRAA